MAIQITFGVLSASAHEAALQQLVDVLGQRHAVVLHHDFGQHPTVAVTHPRCHVVRPHVATGWGTWGQTLAILAVLRHAVESTQFDYLQLLSESCLPIRPLVEFEEFLAAIRPDACIGLIRIGAPATDIGRLNFAWRSLVTRPFVRKLIGRVVDPLRAPGSALDPSKRVLVSGLAVCPPAASDQRSVVQAARRALFRALTSRALNRHPFVDGLQCYVGSTWFCLSRRAAEHVLNFVDTRPDLMAHFAGCRNSDEAVVHTAIGNSAFDRIVDFNHYVNWSQRIHGPDTLGLADQAVWQRSGKFFARKFPMDPTDSARVACLAAIDGAPPGMLATLDMKCAS
ncbi:beta-1,6-N-acetylglucosaminyltransferase [Ideonella sp. DXS22W]|uniref:Peptide O-xylosyltransferase n=1 Tax=Pseudaquabacterium inlustre TaxID=2984192 RepID=A0ABU9CEK8_9BURK